MAILSLWLAEHQMNKVFEEKLAGYGESRPILPLKESGKIIQGNAARIKWESVCPISKDDESYVIGNPPYQGSRKQSNLQKEDLRFVFSENYKSLDYIAIWFYKGAQYIKKFKAKCAFVSTNSICQGNQVRLNWPRILNDQIEIDFAYHSFKWNNYAKKNAGVTVIIVGLRNTSTDPKYIYIGNIKRSVKNINPYLQEQINIIIDTRENQISNLPKMDFGNMPADNGNLLLTEAERKAMIDKEPFIANWIKPFLSADEFINGKSRFCLWLEDILENEYLKSIEIKKRIDANYIVRLNSSRPKLAKIPQLFAQITQPVNTGFILIPRHSSEKRDYIPIGYFDSSYKAGDSNLIIGTNDPWHFAVVTSRIHMVWVRAVGGKLETRYRYSAKVCYNTFPFPIINDKQKESLNLYVFSILDERAKYPEKTMAWLYNPETMPLGLKNAHKELDKAIERCYRLQPFSNDTERLEYLFKLYEEMSTKDSLFAKQKKQKTRK